MLRRAVEFHNKLMEINHVKFEDWLKITRYFTQNNELLLKYFHQGYVYVSIDLKDLQIFVKFNG